MRIQKLRNFISEKNIDAVLIESPQNRRYFSGFSGSSGVLFITSEVSVLITDFRYVEQAQKEAPDFKVLEHRVDIYETVAECLKAYARKANCIGFEGNFVNFDSYAKLSKTLKTKKLESLNLDPLRAIKDKEEILLIKQAVKIADKAFKKLIPYIKPNVSENKLAAKLEHFMRDLGSEKLAFDTIAASGKRSALPHGRASDKLLEKGDLFTLDFGAVYKGYHSDMTRTVVLGKATKKQKEIYDLVLKAQLAGLDAVAANKVCKDVDNVARKIITEAGHGNHFGHGLGHCVGLEIHEAPSLSPNNKSLLEPNMVVTVEPGVYIPDWGGVRIEDLVVVTKKGCTILTKSEKHLLEL
ncbi:aminopeptidase P family protein [Selenomonadales bacterium OttesenSCG-928-I06]|nr:aminopeptidase P family protein [Selenomonadales bacterium OttesenSCG-928-I06]